MDGQKSSSAPYFTLSNFNKICPLRLTKPPPDKQRQGKYENGNEDDVVDGPPAVLLDWTRFERIDNPVPGGHDGLSRSGPAVWSHEAVLVGNARSKVECQGKARIRPQQINYKHRTIKL